MILAGIVYGAILYLARLPIFALLVVLGLPAMLALGAVVAVEMEREVLHLVSGWKPARPRLVLTGGPVVAAVVALHSVNGWTSWQAWALVVASALVGQALLLCYLTPQTRAGDTRQPRVRLGWLFPSSATAQLAVNARPPLQLGPPPTNPGSSDGSSQAIR